MNKTKLASEIRKYCYLKGRFRLRSGMNSEEYFDKYQFEARPEILKSLAREMIPLLPDHTDFLAGLEMGGIPLATALSLETGIPCLFVRKEAKEYGTCQFAEGPAFRGKTLCLIEDVITTGGQVVASTQALRSAGAIINTVVCAIYRGEGSAHPIEKAGLVMRPLFTAAEIRKS